jgi:hypothetical protein
MEFSKPPHDAVGTPWNARETEKSLSFPCISFPNLDFSKACIEHPRPPPPLPFPSHFADASNLAGSPECEAFASFDRRLARAGAKAGALPVRTP